MPTPTGVGALLVTIAPDLVRDRTLRRQVLVLVERRGGGGGEVGWSDQRTVDDIIQSRAGKDVVTNIYINCAKMCKK